MWEDSGKDKKFFYKKKLILNNNSSFFSNKCNTNFFWVSGVGRFSLGEGTYTLLLGLCFLRRLGLRP